MSCPTIEVTKTADPTAVPETGGDVTFTFVVKNTSTEEPVTIPSLKTVSMARWLAMTTARLAPSWLQAQPVSSPSPSGWKATSAGPDHVNVFTAKAEDNDGTEATDDDDATVDFTNVAARPSWSPRPPTRPLFLKPVAMCPSPSWSRTPPPKSL